MNVTPSARSAPSSLSIAPHATVAHPSTQVTTIVTPSATQILAVSQTGAVYFGSTNQGGVMPGFCAGLGTVSYSASCNLGSGTLYEYSGGSFTQTNPHGPYFGFDPHGKNGKIHEFAVSFQPFSIAATPQGCVSAAVWVGALGDELAEIAP